MAHGDLNTRLALEGVARDLKLIAEEQVIRFRRDIEQESLDLLDGVRNELTDTVAATLKHADSRLGEEYQRFVQEKMTQCIDDAFGKANPRRNPTNHNSSSNDHSIELPYLDRARSLLAFSVARRLQKRGIGLPDNSVLKGDTVFPNYFNVFYRAVSALVDDFNARYEKQFGAAMGLAFFRNYSEQLHASVLHELFMDDHLNWGRIIATMAFAGYAAEGWMKVEGDQDRASPDLIVDWTLAFFEQEVVQAWIVKHGGWTGLVRFFEDGPVKKEPPVTNNWVLPTAVAIGASFVVMVLFWVGRARS